MGKFKYAGTLIGEFWDFARKNKVYWIVPLIVVFLLVAFLVIASQGSVPFIYTLF